MKRNERGDGNSGGEKGGGPGHECAWFVCVALTPRDLATPGFNTPCMAAAGPG